MVEDNQVVVQPGAVPTEGTPSLEVVTPAVVTPPTPSPEEILNQKIAEAVSKALVVETEKSRREIQSAKDKAMAEVQTAQRRARLAESTLGATREHIKTLDPEVAKEMELTELRAREQNRLTVEQEEAVKQQQEAYQQALHASLINHLSSLGIAPTDPRVNWGDATDDFLSGRQKFDASVASIIKENAKASEASLDAKIKEAEKRIRKALGAEEDVNSVSTQMSGGISGKGIPTDMNKFRDWIGKLPIAEYEKLKPDIEDMMAKGLIK